jgi:crotonobetainyl-CoA:carnitine CoA-transferase CaiB-like acyl-CoA transferase
MSSRTSTSGLPAAGRIRPGTLAARGLGPEQLAELSPGIVVLDLSAYGHAGPWWRRRGFDSLVQMASGIADDGARTADVPTPTPLPAVGAGQDRGWTIWAGSPMTCRPGAR